MKEKAAKKLTRKVTYAGLHRLAAAVSLLAFFVILGAGIMAGASVVTMSIRAFIVIVTVGVVTKLITRILANYEEIQSG